MREFWSDYKSTIEALQLLIFELPNHQSNVDVPIVGYASNILRASFRAMPWQKAVDLLKSTPPSILEERILVFNYLTGQDGEHEVALFDRHELADLIIKFRNFLIGEREYLIKTGLPQRRFRECRWLENRLAKTYPIRRATNELPDVRWRQANALLEARS